VVDAVAAPAPRVRGRRHSLHRARAQHHAQRRHALWRQPRRRAAGRPATQRRRVGACACARPPHRHPRGEAAMTVPAAVPPSRWLLRLALLALVLLYSTWYVLDSQWVALGVFALPPLLLALALPRSGSRAAFWAGLLALAWFSHGVMVAWSRH